MEGFKKWQKEGLGKASKIIEATNEYQEESDAIGNYIEERCFVGPEYKVQTSVILKDLQQWAKDNGLRYIKRSEFIDYMKRRGFPKDKISFGNLKGNIFWFGIGLKLSDGYSDEDKRPF